MSEAIDKRLLELGVELPNPAAPAANYVPFIQTGNLLFISGQLPIKDGKLMAMGLLGRELGPEAGKVLEALSESLGEEPPRIPDPPDDEHVLYWRRFTDRAPKQVKALHPRQVHKRHTRKYAEGVLDEERSFYFRGPDNALNIRAHNLIIFLQIAEGLDDATWEHHLRLHDYSKWFRGRIQDDALADEAEATESDTSLSPHESRERIAQIVRRRYTGPVSERVR